jgi:hypothetical protein
MPDQEVCDVVEKIATKTMKLLHKKGYLQEEGEEVLRPDLDQLFQDHPGMTEAMAASIQSKIAFGERSGEKVRRVGSGFGYEEFSPRTASGETKLFLTPKNARDSVRMAVPTGRKSKITVGPNGSLAPSS